MGISNLFNKVTDIINTKKEETQLLNQKISNSLIFELNNDIVINNENLVQGNFKEYMQMCPYINLDDAKKIDGLIPINETVINIFYANQKKDNQKIIIVLTNNRILIIGKDKYKEYNYQDITMFGQISKSFMTQIIILNGIVLSLDINQNDLNIFYNLITNTNYRNNYILEKTKYLCGINPVYQRINKINSGVSIDNNNIIVFHDKKVNNYICKYEEILNYELMEDNTPVLRKRTNNQSHGMGFSKQECSKISIRVTLVNNQVFEINILEPSAFNKSYSHMDNTYIENYNFAKEIIDKLDSFNTNLYY